jgi:hypothetical protein
VARKFSLLLTALVVAGLAGRAHAAGAKAEALVDQAVELRRNGDDEGALALLLQAYGMGHLPRATGQLGLCEQALGRWPEADTYLTEALKAESDPWVKRNRRALEDAIVIVKGHLARVEMQGEPDGAEVWVNGVLVGKLPLTAPVRVGAGEIEIELRTPGSAPETKTIRLEAGQYQRIVMRASKPPVAPAASAQPALVAVSTEPPRASGEPAATAVAAPASSNGRRALKWVAWGLGAAGLGVGIYGTTQNSSLVASFDKVCGIDPATGNARDIKTGMYTADCANRKSDYESKARLGVAGFVAGGALAAAGFILWLTEPSAPAHDGTALSCAPGVSSGGAEVSCGMRF